MVKNKKIFTHFIILKCNTSDESEEDEEEFFDCETETDEFSMAGDVVPRRKSRHSLWNKPAGRLRRCGTLRLLHSGEPMYLPVTQVKFVTLNFNNQLELGFND